MRGLPLDSVGTVLCVDDDGIVRIGFNHASRGWQADPAEIQRVEEFKVGDWVKVRSNLTATKYGLGAVTPGSIGVVSCIRPDYSLLLEFSFLSSLWLCEPEEVESAVPFRVGKMYLFAVLFFVARCPFSHFSFAFISREFPDRRQGMCEAICCRTQICLGW